MDIGSMSTPQRTPWGALGLAVWPMAPPTMMPFLDSIDMAAALGMVAAAPTPTTSKSWAALRAGRSRDALHRLTSADAWTPYFTAPLGSPLAKLPIAPPRGSASESGKTPPSLPGAQKFDMVPPCPPRASSAAHAHSNPGTSVVLAATRVSRLAQLPGWQTPAWEKAAEALTEPAAAMAKIAGGRSACRGAPTLASHANLKARGYEAAATRTTVAMLRIVTDTGAQPAAVWNASGTGHGTNRRPGPAQCQRMHPRLGYTWASAERVARRGHIAPQWRPRGSASKAAVRTWRIRALRASPSSSSSTAFAATHMRWHRQSLGWRAGYRLWRPIDGHALPAVSARRRILAPRRSPRPALGRPRVSRPSGRQSKEPETSSRSI